MIGLGTKQKQNKNRQDLVQKQKTEQNRQEQEQKQKTAQKQIGLGSIKNKIARTWNKTKQN